MPIEIRLINNDDINDMKSLILQWGKGKFRFLMRFKPNLLAGFWSAELEQACKISESVVFVYNTNTSIKGLIVFSPSPWESHLCKKKMGVINFIVYDPNDPDSPIIIQELIRAVIDYAKEHQFNFLACKCYSNDTLIIHSLQTMRFLLIDAMLDFVFDFQKSPSVNQDNHSPPDINYEVRLANPSDRNSTVKMVKKSFNQHFGRFHSDPQILKEKADELYCEWIKSSFNGYADLIIVAVMEEEVIGCSLWKKESALETKNQLSIGHYSLGCVHPDHSGKGVFQQITHQGLQYFSNQNIRFIEGPTHINNHPVHSAYKNMNWSIMDARFTFHLWL